MATLTPTLQDRKNVFVEAYLRVRVERNKEQHQDRAHQLLRHSDGVYHDLEWKGISLFTDIYRPSDSKRYVSELGRRHGAATFAFERFDILLELAYMLIKNGATDKQRKAAVVKMSRAIGQDPTSTFFVQQTLHSSRGETGKTFAENQIKPISRAISIDRFRFF
jgi:hypothetical protein